MMAGILVLLIVPSEDPVFPCMSVFTSIGNDEGCIEILDITLN